MNDKCIPQQIAIVGVGCKLPGGIDSPKTFWDFLAAGRDAITEIPPERWDLDHHFTSDSSVPLKQHVRKAGFIEDIDKFDASFFGITPREAISMDPQQRMMLEVAWRAVEDANIPLEQIKSKQVGVFVGISSNDYGSLLWINESGYSTPNNEPFLLPGNTGCIAANRISYIFDLKGPSFTIDTACSSSLVAVHLACQSILSGESEMALVGGVQIIAHPGVQMLFNKAGLLSPDGQCKSFDARANGYVRSEGAGMVLLKPLEKALQDKDNIYAVVLGSAVNSDGRSNGMVAPNLRSQVECVRTAFRAAGVPPAATQYVEAHGTGTRQGDPIEVRALGTVLAEGREEGTYCHLGSVKTNLGHSETAAGITGLIKAALSISRHQIPPSLHFETPNPSIDFEALQLRVQTKLGPFPRPEMDAVVGVSSFGFGGTNAHVVLKQAPKQSKHYPRFGPALPYNILTISAKSQTALRALAKDLATFIQGNPDRSLNDICYSANSFRTVFKERLSFVVPTVEKLAKSLLEVSEGNSGLANVSHKSYSKKTGRLAWAFTGQGSQYAGMGKDLYNSHPVFRNAFEEAAAHLNTCLDRRLQDFLLADRSDSLLNEILADTAYAQPIIFAFGYALSRLWSSWGINPDVLIGHSVGEILAAHIAGVFNLSDACSIVSSRSQLMASLPSGGGMSAFLVSPERLNSFLEVEPYLTIAAYNGPTNTVVAGPSACLERMSAAARAAGIEVKALTVSHAFHTSAMRPMLEDFERAISQISFLPPSKTLISNVSGEIAGSEVATPEYWCRHVISPVRFYQSIAAMTGQDVNYIIEVGARPTLIGMARQWIEEEHILLPSVHPSQPGLSTLLHSLGRLYCEGFAVNWSGFYHDFPAQAIRLPGYPFDRQRFWWPKQYESSDESAEWSHFIHQITSKGHARSTPISAATISASTLSPGSATLAKLDIPSLDHFFSIDLSVQVHHDLEDHRIRSYKVFPAAGFISILVEILQTLHPENDCYHIKDFFLQHPLKLTSEVTRLTIQANAQQNGQLGIKVNSKAHQASHEEWTLHGEAIGTISNQDSPCLPFELHAPPENEDIYDVNLQDFYERLTHFGLVYGPTFRALSQLRCSNNRAWASLKRPPKGLDRGLLDSCFQAVAALLQPNASSGQLVLPVGFADLWATPLPLPDEFECQVELIESTDLAFIECNIILHHNNRILVSISRFRLRSLPRIALDWMFPEKLQEVKDTNDSSNWILKKEWHSIPLDLEQGQLPKGILVLSTSQINRSIRLQPFAEWGQFPLRHHSIEDIISDSKLLGGVETEFVLWPTYSDDSEVSLIETTADQLLQLYKRLSVAKPRPVTLVLEGFGPLQSSLEAMTRTVQQELVSWQFTIVNIPSDPELHPTPAQWAMIWKAATTESSLRWTGESLELSRIQRLSTLERFRYAIQVPGNLDTLTRVPCESRSPQHGEVEVAVEITGLNFRDVLNALGLLKAYSAQLGFDESAEIPFGGECVGRIVAVGPDVDGSRIGERVVAALSIGSLASHVICREQLCSPLPVGLDATTVASVSTAFLTSIHGLLNLAKIQPGEIVLIHAAAGGVGQAALQVAIKSGARIYATASQAKQAALLEQGVEKVFDSRTTDFADQILEITDGRGVDVVLNSLKGEWVDASFRALAQNGRFVELGKIETWSHQKAQTERPDVDYLPFDLLDVAAAQPSLVRSMLDTLLCELKDGTYNPIPITVYDIDKTVDAFRLMSQARHVGKVLISQAAKPDPVLIRSDSTYCVTGALGGIGLQLMEWLAQQGASSIIAISRSASAPSRQASEVLNRLNSFGVECHLLSLDLSDWDSADRMLSDLQDTFSRLDAHKPLHGIFHCAGVVDDGLVDNQTSERLHNVFAPKLVGWHVIRNAFNGYVASHHPSPGSPISPKFIVSFSSISALLGSPGQSTYASANGALDGFAGILGNHLQSNESQRTEPSVILSLQWGPWEGRGMAGSLGKREKDRLKALGVEFLPPETAFDALNQVLRRGISGILAVANNDWQKILDQSGQRVGIQLSLLANPIDAAQTASRLDETRSALIDKLSSYSLEQRQLEITLLLRTRLAKVMGLDGEGSIDPSESLFHLGLDSLMAVELVSIVEADLGVKLTFESLAGEPSLESIAQIILSDLGLSTASVDTELNLRKEAELPSDWRVSVLESTPSQEKVQKVFLTGATGFLGAYLLEGQLRANTNRLVYCLVRSDGLDAAKEKITKNMQHYQIWDASYSDRIVPVLGNLALADLGLDSETYAMISSQAEGIIHNGAQLSQMATYSQLAKTNVFGTKNIVELALQKCIPIQMVSSVAALEATAYRGKPILEDQDITECDGIVNGYSQTKWVSERLVLNAAKLGLPVTVYRPPLISGDSKLGIWHQDDLLYRLLEGCLKMGSFPDIAWELDLVPVDYVADAITALAWSPQALNRTYHLHHPSPILLSDLVQAITSFGRPLTQVPMGDWIETIAEDPTNPLNPMLPFFTKRWGDDQFTYPELNRKGLRAEPSSTYTSTVLNTLGISCPSFQSLALVYGQALLPALSKS
ncbi:SDR family NAD(P)-dependent oxidoreductase [Synechococcus sp. BSF8S]|uniref:type I polyketide synthase n=1 Tax=Synechococcales TaxID=1890424 RepID=UPI00162341B1|nr:SDR family NAD(P)-dependent oxidoreductase [Synechococcus sp. BSF8S]MBC1265405.1 SDR family NAD(P)-dependent oxidoreductase [Synechococcus sp. BSA11S]